MTKLPFFDDGGEKPCPDVPHGIHVVRHPYYGVIAKIFVAGDETPDELRSILYSINLSLYDKAFPPSNHRSGRGDATAITCKLNCGKMECGQSFSPDMTNDKRTAGR